MDDSRLERLSAHDALRLLTNPSSVAIIGGSADPSKIAGRPVKFLRQGGYRGQAYIVNPSLPKIEGYESIADISLLPHPPDVAFVALGAKAAIGATRQLAEIGTPVAIVLASGFADGGPEGLVMQQELSRAAGSMRMLGPNTLGMINLSDAVMLTPSDSLESPGLSAGAISVVSQSGGIMASLLSRAAGRGIGFSKLYSTGNEADLEVSDCIEFLATDEPTTVIALYLETLRDPTAFIAAAQLARRNQKSIVCYKVGLSEAGARAAASHTGALAGADRIFDAVFERAGVLRVRRFSELLELPMALATTKRRRGNRVGVLTTTGGAGTLIADACGAAGLQLPIAMPELVSELEELFPDAGLDLSHNPIDLTLSGTKPEVMGPVIDAVVASSGYDAVIVIIGSSGVAQPRLVADPLIAAAMRSADKPVFAYASPFVPQVLERLNRAGVPAFDAPESCVAALAALGSDDLANTHDANDRTEDLSAGRALNEHDAKSLLSRYGIATPNRVVVKDLDELEELTETLSGPIALKVLSSGLAHKSDIGGVALGLSKDQVRSGAQQMLEVLSGARPELSIEGWLAEEMHSGVELLLGMVRDPALGPAIVLGSGGIAAELYADTAVVLPPVDRSLARDMLRRLRIAPLLLGARGQGARDVEALFDAIVSFSELVVDMGKRLIDAEINPLVVLEPGKGVVALDALVHLDEQAGEQMYWRAAYGRQRR